MERLFLLGLLLMAISFLEMYLATANLQISQDRSATALETLSKGIEGNLPKLEALFKSKNAMVSKVTPTSNSTTSTSKKLRRVAWTRMMLGLPPKKEPDKAMQAPSHPEIKTYEGMLDELVRNAAQTAGVDPNTLEQFRDSKKSPSEILKELNAAVATIEQKPTSVWGIKTPRLVKLQYA
jgi:hypothetical protein